ncbi:bactoprenol glucosyl transferase homolog fromprophage CPS-53 [Striga asiatica]|uniref:Bactoprenol glucosyl transferase homolog fromprophage CPS-53 n=1 Tax=Striga asiatica TaxID=4170 RepID=A0A5A7PZ93_STRAF|nr:bactoprenol glucosyl transferase homolog fromprophage CPS-53 [Striga asiatica]
MLVSGLQATGRRGNRFNLIAQAVESNPGVDPPELIRDLLGVYLRKAPAGRTSTGKTKRERGVAPTLIKENPVPCLRNFRCPETLTALLLMSRQTGGYQDVVKASPKPNSKSSSIQ